MLIGRRLRELRESTNLRRGDVEKQTGLLRCYAARAENGHTVLSLETLEKYARALEIPTYRFIYEGDKPPKMPELPTLPTLDDGNRTWGAGGKEAEGATRFC
jgi:transcriptional regulator with XRE-family HTH domain